VPVPAQHVLAWPAKMSRAAPGSRLVDDARAVEVAGVQLTAEDPADGCAACDRHFDHRVHVVGADAEAGASAGPFTADV